MHALTRDEPVTLLLDLLDHRVLDRASTESLRAYLFLAIWEELRVRDDGKNVVTDVAALESDMLLALKLSLLSLGD